GKVVSDEVRKSLAASNPRAAADELKGKRDGLDRALGDQLHADILTAWLTVIRKAVDEVKTQPAKLDAALQQVNQLLDYDDTQLEALVVKVRLLRLKNALQQLQEVLPRARKAAAGNAQLLAELQANEALALAGSDDAKAQKLLKELLTGPNPPADYRV